jgi:hypothetical protein
MVMKKNFVIVVLLFLIFGFATFVHADLNSFLDKLNIEANADMNGFTVKLSNQFGIPLQQVQTIIQSVRIPGDAFMCLQLGYMTKRPPNVVLQTYKKHTGKGWGNIAKQLGIKPGSPEFHALKGGDFVFNGMPVGDSDTGKGRGKGKGRNK